MINRLHHFALAPSTQSTYATGFRAYQLFCSQVSLPTLPLLESTLQRFVASLTFRIGFKTIKVYLSGIQYWSIMCGDPAHISGMPRLFYLLRGIRRVQGVTFRRARRMPITVTQLFIIHYRLQFLQYTNFERLMFRTMSSLAFFGLL